jgi:hypothetical protein
MRESRRDVGALRGLMSHSRIDATQLYTDEIELDELAAALDRAAASRHAQASPDPTTLETELTDELEKLRWRRRESNPRSQQSARDSAEDPDLANADAAETASEASHKPGSLGSVPTVDPGQLTVFDFLYESVDGRIG